MKLAEDNIVANAIAPGFIETKMSTYLIHNFGELINQGIPMKRVGEEDDLKG